MRIQNCFLLLQLTKTFSRAQISGFSYSLASHILKSRVVVGTLTSDSWSGSNFCFYLGTCLIFLVGRIPFKNNSGLREKDSRPFSVK